MPNWNCLSNWNLFSIPFSTEKISILIFSIQTHLSAFSVNVTVCTIIKYVSLIQTGQC